jgi:hypothetical protein
MWRKEQYVAKMEAQLNEWSAKLAAMKAKLEAAELEGRAEFHKQLDASQRQHEIARRHLDELKQSSEEAWEALKAGVEVAWKEFTTSVDTKPK